MAKVPASMEDKKKSYYKYYLQDMAPVPQEKYDQIAAGPMDNAVAPLIQNRNDLFNPGYMPAEFGWWLLPDGTALIANQTFFPNTTGEMFDWWFAWHPIDRLRYACWDSEDHYDVYLNDPARALDMSLSMRERHWGSIHNVWESLDSSAPAGLLQIRFKRPGEMGYDESKIDTPACNALVCANCSTIGNDQIPDVPVVMTHFLRPVEGGSELRSRFWLGWQIINGEAVMCIPDGISVPAEVPKTLLGHNVKEFTNLAAILPSIYAEEKDNWEVKI